MSLLSKSLHAQLPTRLAVLGDDFLVAARRWPSIIASLHALTVEQADRTAAQLAICQLPRVDTRLMAMMWLLAETWGRVTPRGIRLPLHFSHQTLGGLVGARRSTVTLALRQLHQQGALIRERDGWLITKHDTPSSEALAAGYEVGELVAAS